MVCFQLFGMTSLSPLKMRPSSTESLSLEDQYDLLVWPAIDNGAASKGWPGIDNGADGLRKAFVCFTSKLKQVQIRRHLDGL